MEEFQCLNNTIQGNTRLDVILESHGHCSKLCLKGTESHEDLKGLSCVSSKVL